MVRITNAPDGIEDVRADPDRGRRHFIVAGLLGTVATPGFMPAARAQTGTGSAGAGIGNTPAPGGTAAGAAALPGRGRKFRFGLALGGGAARGFAHVGVISVLEQEGLIPDIVVGTSAGSLVGALYASGMGAKALREMSGTIDEVALGDWNIGARGVVKGDALQSLVNKAVQGRRIEQFAKPFAAVTTDLFNGKMRILLSGDPGLAVRASSAVPSVFAPVQIDGRDYVDGGLSSPVPVSVCRALGAQVVLAVDISAKPSFQPTDTLPQVLLQTFAIMGQNLAAGELRLADVVVSPDIGDISSMGFAQRQLAIDEGASAMRKKLAELRRKLAAAA